MSPVRGSKDQPVPRDESSEDMPLKSRFSNVEVLTVKLAQSKFDMAKEAAGTAARQ